MIINNFIKDKKYDFIVVGAGSAGSALAYRLVENRKYIVLLVEAGGLAEYRFIDRLKNENFGLDLLLDWAKVPIGMNKLWLNKQFVWPFYTEPERNMSGQRHYWPRGKVLGGTSSINGLICAKGDPYLYDLWGEESNGWKYDDLLPYLIKFENRISNNIVGRGVGGPIDVSDVCYKDEISEAFFKSCIDYGINESVDYNIGEHYVGVSYLQMTIGKGKRCSTAVGYIDKIKNIYNIDILINTEVTGLLIEGNKTIGIKCHNNLSSHFDIKSNKEVILSAGSIKTPYILELSGIGNSDILKENNISVVKNLPGVGENLSDHTGKNKF